MDLLMAELIKLAEMSVSCMGKITLTLYGAPGDYNLDLSNFLSESSVLSYQVISLRK